LDALSGGGVLDEAPEDAVLEGVVLEPEGEAEGVVDEAGEEEELCGVVLDAAEVELSLFVVSVANEALDDGEEVGRGIRSRARTYGVRRATWASPSALTERTAHEATTRKASHRTVLLMATGWIY